MPIDLDLEPKLGLILPYQGIRPRIAADVFVAPTAVIVGDVEIGEACGIWFNVVMRADVNMIRIGSRVNIQDGTIIHVSRNVAGTVIGDDVSVGHGAMIHACTLQSGSFVGMGAMVLDEAVVETDAMLAAGALLTPGKRVLSGELWAGRPAKFFRKLNDEDYDLFRRTTERYCELAQSYRRDLGYLADPSI